jgi:hypothetical protein
MEILKRFMWEYRFILVLVAAVVIYALLEWKKFKYKAFGLMKQARQMAKEAILNSGQEQEDWVVEKLYIILPKPIGVLIPSTTMHKIVKFIYKRVKDYLDDGKLNNSVG